MPQLQDLYDQYKTPEDFARQLGNVYTTVANNKDPSLIDFYKGIVRDYEAAAEHYFPQQGVQGAKGAAQAAKDAAQAEKDVSIAQRIAQEKEQLQGSAFGYGYRATAFQAKNQGQLPRQFQHEFYTQDIVDRDLQAVQASIRRLQDLGVPLNDIQPILEKGTNEGSSDLIQYAGELNSQAAGLKGSGFSGVLRGLVSMLAVIPSPLQPFAAGVQAIDSVNQGNTLGALASLAGIPGISEAATTAGAASAVSTVQTANKLNNLVKAVESDNLLGALSSGVSLTGTGGVEIGDTGYNVADALKAANITKALGSGNYNVLIKALAPGAKFDGPNKADFEKGYFAPGGEGYYDFAVAESIAPTSDSLGYTPSNQEILDAIGYTSEESLDAIKYSSEDITKSVTDFLSNKVDYSLATGISLPKTDGLKVDPITDAGSTVGISPVDYSLTGTNITDGLGLKMPTSPNINAMGGGQGITVKTPEGELSESGVRLTGTPSDLGDPNSFINKPPPDGKDSSTNMSNILNAGAKLLGGAAVGAAVSSATKPSTPLAPVNLEYGDIYKDAPIKGFSMRKGADGKFTPFIGEKAQLAKGGFVSRR